MSDGPDSAFSEVTGLEAEREVETVAEGGENRFVHRLPGRVTHRNLVLKRGIMATTSPLRRWCIEAIESDLAQPLSPMDIDVSLLNAEGTPAAVWSVVGAWPVKMDIGAFNASDNSYATETLELAFNRVTRRIGDPLDTISGIT